MYPNRVLVETDSKVHTKKGLVQVRIRDLPRHFSDLVVLLTTIPPVTDSLPVAEICVFLKVYNQIEAR